MAGAVRKALSGDGFAAAFCATSVALALAFAFPQPAFAGIAEDINAWLCGILRDTCNWIFAGQADMLRSIGADGVLATLEKAARRQACTLTRSQERSRTACSRRTSPRCSAAPAT